MVEILKLDPVIGYDVRIPDYQLGDAWDRFLSKAYSANPTISVKTVNAALATGSIMEKIEQFNRAITDKIQMSATNNAQSGTMNETAASPTTQSIAIPGIVVIGGLIALYFLSK